MPEEGEKNLMHHVDHRVLLLLLQDLVRRGLLALLNLLGVEPRLKHLHHGLMVKIIGYPVDIWQAPSLLK